MSCAEAVLRILARVADTGEVLRNPDLRLYDLQILDSLRTVELILALSQELGVDISPAELEHDDWATPRQIVGYVEARLAS